MVYPSPSHFTVMNCGMDEIPFAFCMDLESTCLVLTGNVGWLVI